jgi:hypothetical protein
MDVHPDRPLREAEGCITRQQKIVSELQAHGHLGEAQQAREILALFHQIVSHHAGSLADV